MSARILVAANTRASVKPIEARLSAAYFDVLVALSGAETLAICGQGQCDIVLIAGRSGEEVRDKLMEC